MKNFLVAKISQSASTSQQGIIGSDSWGKLDNAHVAKIDVIVGGAREFVLDAELVAVDREDENRLRAFQELSTRARGQTEMHQVIFDFLISLGQLVAVAIKGGRNI